MPAAKKRIHRQGEPDISRRGAWGFAVAFIVIGVCLAELVRVFCVCVFWP